MSRSLTQGQAHRARGMIVFAATHPSGGIRELWGNLADALAERGFETQCVAFYPPRWGEAGGGDGSGAGRSWLHFVSGPLRNPVRAVRLVFALARWLRAHEPRLVVTAMPAANVLVPIVARWSSPATRVAISHHSPVETHAPLLNRLDAWSGQLRNVRAIISVSHAVSASLASKPAAYRAKRRAIRNALPPDIETYLFGMAGEVRDAPTQRRIVSTGRLAYQKNYPMLLRALAEVPDASLDIVGTGPDEAELRALAEQLGIAERVRFLGVRPRREALAILAGGDVFVQVSRFEGHSLGLIEAARVGLPLIVSNVPEQVEAVTAEGGDACGIVVPLDDDAALAGAITAVLNDSAAYRRWSAAARRIAEEARFDAVVDAYEALAV
ncbi:glycosyltransferase [Novosphingobium sp. EMRT-2]|nr:glycosyltransferase [Novosphingobium sp. EMRT-2]